MLFGVRLGGHGFLCFGGPLADKYPPRKLIAIALWMTALGGFLFAQYPALWVLQVLYGWWGFTTIFLLGSDDRGHTNLGR